MLRKLGQKLLHSPFHPLYVKLVGSPREREYRRFLEALARNSPPPEWFARQIESWNYRPIVSVLMAVRNPKREWFEQAVRSVVEQNYPNWQLCIIDDDSDITPVVMHTDTRIQFASLQTRHGISGALNRALEMATGDYIGVLDHDDFLSADALFRVVEALQSERYDVLYSDEDYVDENGVPVRPNFKPGWSPELLSNCMYMGHLVVASKELMLATAGFRSEYDGAQDYDLALRLTDNPVRVAHLPHILYHWRQHGESIAQHPGAKPWANDSGHRAAADMLLRRGWNAHVLDDENPTRYHIVRDWKGSDLVSIIGIESLEKTDYGEMEFVNSANEAKGSYLVFLHADVRPLASDWLTNLLAIAQRPEVGAVGAKLISPDGSLQHSGLALGMLGGVGNPGRGLYQSDYWRWLHYTRNVTAVSSVCMVVRKEVFEAVGGFDDAFTSDYADADFCLRLRELGLEVILEQRATLVQQGVPPAVSREQQERFRKKWAKLLASTDRYFSPHLRTNREDTSLLIGSVSVGSSRQS
jgi:GT2 family glycosyltransferase